MAVIPRDDRPNIVVIMTDQQRGDCLGVENHPVLLTPQMDELARQGVRFSRTCSTCPVSIPARRSFMTGQFPATHGMVGYADGHDWNSPPTLPGVLKRSGYETCIVGRNMHLHPVRKRFGFDHMAIAGGVRHGPAGEYERWLEKNQPRGAGGYRGGGVTYNDWTARPWHMEEHLHLTNWTVGQALTFLKDRDPTCPYFLVVSFVAPHPPLNPPAFYMDRYLHQDLPAPVIGDWAQPPQVPFNRVDDSRINLGSHATRNMQAGYFGLINHVDDQIRRLLNPVDNPVGRNAVVFFTSDHGEMLGDHYMFRKSLPYEGALRVPLLVRGARGLGFKADHVVDQPVCLEDIMPTCLELAGCEAPPSVEGRSLLPLLRGQEPSWRDQVHCEHHPSGWHALVERQWKYVWWCADGREQLFDLRNDPGELHDLAPDTARQGELERLRGRLVERLRDRPEQYVEAGRLVPGRKTGALLPHHAGTGA
jgi:arylsulfatase A-like enzyme